MTRDLDLAGLGPPKRKSLLHNGPSVDKIQSYPKTRQQKSTTANISYCGFRRKGFSEELPQTIFPFRST
jgi:hypothetical protein